MQAVQGTLDDLGTPLHEVTFVVVDLETTGGSPATSRITEVGAVKVRGGQVLGEFQTLVNPGRPIPAFISVLTGITDGMVAGAPRIESVLPAFLEFAREAVLVAHNAPFDISFLKAATAAMGLTWPKPLVVDTVHLARQLVTKEEAVNRRLSTLAALFGATTSPDHRALHDARATVDVLHALIARVGGLGVHTLEELTSYTARVGEAQRRKRHLADGLPSTPGVYVFRDSRGRPLYVGTSRNVRRRVMTYFTSSEQRSRMARMVALAESVTAVPCVTDLEASVRELRLIAEHDPPFNRRSRKPAGRPWVKLTAEAFPRLSVVREVRPDGATYAGPFSSRRSAQGAVEALLEALPLRQCTTRIGRTSESPACVLSEIGRCAAPCRAGDGRESYLDTVGQAVDMLAGDSRAVLAVLQQRMDDLAAQERYEQAGLVRDRMAHLVRGAARAQRLRPMASIPELVAARRLIPGGWEVVCVRYGRLAGTTLAPRGADPMPYIEALRATAENVLPPVPPSPAASWEETALVLAWLEREGTRLVATDGEWTCPVNGAGSVRSALPEPASDAPPPSRWLSPTSPREHAGVLVEVSAETFELSPARISRTPPSPCPSRPRAPAREPATVTE